MSSLQCRTCGTKLLEGERRCWHCGAKPNADPPPERAAPPAPAPAPAPPLGQKIADGIFGELPPPAETPAEAEAPPSGFALPLQAHLILYTAGGCGCAGGLIMLTVITAAITELKGPAFMVPLLAGGFLGFFVPGLLLRHLIPARCPRCGGPARLEGRAPLEYHCTNCGHVHKTGVTESGGGG